jgi:hypothetical protein
MNSLSKHLIKHMGKCVEMYWPKLSLLSNDFFSLSYFSTFVLLNRNIFLKVEIFLDFSDPSNFILTNKIK